MPASLPAPEERAVRAPWSSAALTILGFVGLRPMSGYDIKQMAESTIQQFWALSYGQIYPQLHRLTEAGLVERDPGAEQSSVRSRILYRITDEGRAALEEWLHRESEPPRYRDEGLAKLFLAGRLDPDRALRMVRERQDELRASLAAIRQDVDHGVLGGRTDPYARLAADYGLTSQRAELEWCERTEAALLENGSPANDPAPRAGS